jgi:hypothetical protein
LEKITPMNNSTLKSLAAIGLCLPFFILTFHADAAIPPQSENDKAKTFVKYFLSGNDSATRNEMDAGMKFALTKAKAKQVRVLLHSRLGALKTEGKPTNGFLAGYKVVYVPCDFQNGLLDAKVVYNASGQVTGLFFVTHGQK